jgi:hypothetical protein
MTQERVSPANPSGSSKDCWSLFDILRSAPFQHGALSSRPIWNRQREYTVNNEFDWPRTNQDKGLTRRAKFDMFKRFAQKRRGLQETAKHGERRQVRGHPDASLGLDPTSPLRRILVRIFDKLVEHASREKESGFGLIILTR